MTATEREPWQRLRASEVCEACGHKGWCRYTSTTIECSRKPEGSFSTYTNRDGLPVYLHQRTGVPAATAYHAERRDERTDWANTTSPEGYAYLYTMMYRDFARPAAPPHAVAADARRFGDHAEAARGVECAFYLADPEGLVRRIAAEGRTQDAKNAGILYPDDHERAGQLVSWVKCRKLYAWLDPQGYVRDLRGRALDKSTPKVLSLAGSRDDRGAAGSWYQQGQLAACDGHSRIAGGHEKTDALIVAGLPCVGSNEGQASDAMIATLVNAGVILATLHIDGEDAKDGRPLSEGQRLGLAIGDRLEAAGIAVRIAEPLRSPGEPKLDADTILRDHGPEALRDIDRRAVPLSLFRRRLGITPDDDDPERTKRLQEALREARDERDQAQQWSRVTFAALRAGGGDVPLMKKIGRAGLGVALEWDVRRHQGKDQIIDPDGKRFVALDLTACGKNVGLADDAEAAAVTYLCKVGIAEKLTKMIPRENPAPGQFPYRRQLYVHFPYSTKEEVVAAIAAHRPEKTPDQQPQGGARTACPSCGGTKTKTITVCADCGTALDDLGDEVKLQDAGYRLTTEEITQGDAPPAPAEGVNPQVAVLPLHLPFCLNRKVGGAGCHHRVDRRGDRYCASCAAEGYENLAATVYGFAAAGD